MDWIERRSAGVPPAACGGTRLARAGGTSALRHLSLPEDIGVRKPEPQRYSRSPTTCYVRYSLPWVILCCREAARWSTSTGEILDAMRSSKKGVRLLPTASRRTYTTLARTAPGP